MVTSAATRTIPSFQRVHLVLVKLGIDVGPVYRDLGIRERDLQDEPSGVTMVKYLELLSRISEEQGRPSLGLEMALARDLGSLGVLGYMVRNAPDFERALAITDDYLDLIMPGCRTGLVRLEQDCIWTYEMPGISPAKCRHEIEQTLMQFIGAARELLSLPQWYPTQVFFQHAEPQDCELLREEMADTLHFDHHYNGVMFPAGFLRYTISEADPKLLGLLEQQVQHSLDLLKHDNTLVGRITFMITSRLGKTEVSAETISSRIGMSRRTLHRRLSEQGTSFNEIREMVVLQIAKKALSTTDVSITELAQELGYSDSSALDRAFKRLTGFSPLSYRRNHTVLTPVK